MKVQGTRDTFEGGVLLILKILLRSRKILVFLNFFTGDRRTESKTTLVPRTLAPSILVTLFTYLYMHRISTHSSKFILSRLGTSYYLLSFAPNDLIVSTLLSPKVTPLVVCHG